MVNEKKVLIVDYDAQSLETLSGLLKSQKLEIVKASDGQAGYDKFKQEKPDLVILEAILPKVHGFDLTKRISQDSNGSVAVVIVTGLYRGPQYRHEALSSFGAADYFEKPVDPERFISTVIQLLRNEDDIEDELPDADSVMERLARKIRPAAGRAGKAALKEKETPA